jgi:hypothetical protein
VLVAESDIKTESLKVAVDESKSAQAGTGGALDIQRCGSTFLVFEYIEVNEHHSIHPSTPPAHVMNQYTTSGIIYIYVHRVSVPIIVFLFATCIFICLHAIIISSSFHHMT